MDGGSKLIQFHYQPQLTNNYWCICVWVIVYVHKQHILKLSRVTMTFIHPVHHSNN